MVRGVRYRMYPSPGDERRLERARALHCELYNIALRHRVEAWGERGEVVTRYDQHLELTRLRRRCPRFRRLNAASQQRTLGRLDSAFRHFYRRLEGGADNPGFPGARSPARYAGWSYTEQQGWTLLHEPDMDGGHVRLHDVDVTVPLRGRPRTPGRVKELTVLHHGGKWWMALALECEPVRSIGPAASGLHGTGSARLLFMADAWAMLERDGRVPQPLVAAALEAGAIDLVALGGLSDTLRRIGIAERTLARRRRGSANHERSRTRLLSLRRRRDRQRHDLMHKISAWLVVRHGRVVASIEDAGPNAAAADPVIGGAAGTFLALVRYKAGEAGIAFECDPQAEICGGASAVI